jgi:hypothetical protein
MVRVLSTSSDVRKEIVRLFSRSRGRRIAISAFVGDGAESYLPSPSGLLLICWPKAGGTNPAVLRRLIKRGAIVQFVHSLHMKVYWTSDLGSVVTSANLSTNAMGSGGLKEVGVLLPEGMLKIDHILRSLNVQPATSAALRRLDKQHKEYFAKNPKQFPRRQPARTFVEWYESPARDEWKLGMFSTVATKPSRKTQELAQQEYGRLPYDFIGTKKGDYTLWDWALKFRLHDGRLNRPSWICVSNLIPIPRADKLYKQDWPYVVEAVQNGPPREYPPPPFRIDAPFRTAFRNAVHRFGPHKLEELESVSPPKKLIALLHEQYTRSPS